MESIGRRNDVHILLIEQHNRNRVTLQQLIPHYTWNPAVFLDPEILHLVLFHHPQNFKFRRTWSFNFGRRLLCFFLRMLLVLFLEVYKVTDKFVSSLIALSDSVEQEILALRNSANNQSSSRKNHWSPTIIICETLWWASLKSGDKYRCGQKMS